MRFFPEATSLLKRATFIHFWFLKDFLRFFNLLFLWLCIKDSNYLLFKRGLRLFKGLCLLFLPNVPGAMLIQGGTFIPDSRVCLWYLCLWYVCLWYVCLWYVSLCMDVSTGFRYKKNWKRVLHPSIEMSMTKRSSNTLMYLV